MGNLPEPVPISERKRGGSPFDDDRVELANRLMMEMDILIPIHEKMPEGLGKAKVGMRIALIGDYLGEEYRLVQKERKEIGEEGLTLKNEILEELGFGRIFRHPSCPEGMVDCGNVDKEKNRAVSKEIPLSRVQRYYLCS